MALIQLSRVDPDRIKKISRKHIMKNQSEDNELRKITTG